MGGPSLANLAADRGMYFHTFSPSFRQDFMPGSGLRMANSGNRPHGPRATPQESSLLAKSHAEKRFGIRRLQKLFSAQIHRTPKRVGCYLQSYHKSPPSPPIDEFFALRPPFVGAILVPLGYMYAI